MTATTDNTSEFLRLALPLMSRHGVPVTPKNYAVWYEYVAGANSALQEEINRRMAEKEPFSEAANDDLYQRFVSECDVAAFSRVRAEMRQLLREVGAALASAGSDADRYGLCLNGTVSEIERAGSLERVEQRPARQLRRQDARDPGPAAGARPRPQARDDRHADGSREPRGLLRGPRLGDEQRQRREPGTVPAASTTSSRSTTATDTSSATASSASSPTRSSG